MFREDYKRLYSRVRPDGQLLEETVRLASEWKARTFISFGKAAAAAFVICLFIGMPAAAAATDTGYQVLYLISPGAAQFFKPVKKADEDNGIRMEVVSAYIHGDTAEIFITMQDLTGDRIDETTDLFDSYSVNRPFDSTASCRSTGFNEEAGEVSFLITIQEWGGQEISGDKITFSVREFLSKKKESIGQNIPIDLSGIQNAQETQTVELIGESGNADKYKTLDGTLRALVPGAPDAGFPVEGIDLTGIGYIDGKLHIQTAVKEALDNDNHGFFYLLDAGGNRIESEAAYSFLNQDEQHGRIDYKEFIFDIPQQELGKYILTGDFYTSGLKTEGRWQITFPLETAE